MPEQKRLRRCLTSISANLFILSPVLLLFLFSFILFLFRSGIKVIVENTGHSPLHLLVIHVTGESYSMGDLAPGASVTTTVSPDGESDLEIEFTDTNGNKRRLIAGCYIEPNYRATIRLSIKDGVIDRSELQFHFPQCSYRFPSLTPTHAAPLMPPLLI